MVRSLTARQRACIALAFALGALSILFLSRGGSSSTIVAQAPDPCAGPSVNPIACENSKTGNPASEWDVSGLGSSGLQGFATDISVNRGQTIRFKVDTSATAFRIDIYRLGYYAGLGARKIDTVAATATVARSQPNCLTDGSTGLVDCGNWSESASWAVPATATSGIYIARLVATAGISGASHIGFIVRDDEGHSDILFQTSDTTWQAYNQYGGNSLYVGSPAGRAYEVSYNRPITTRGTGPEDWIFNAESPMVRWLESNGYNVSYSTGVDTDRRGAELLEHKLFMTVGHDEYWSGNQRANVEAARAAGINMAFFAGNEVFWKTRWQNSIDGSATPYRTLVCYKETHANAKIDPTSEWTGTWRDPRFSPPSDGGRPENGLTGTIFTVNAGTSAIKVPEALGKARLWRNTTVATQAAGQTATLAANTLGYEWDEDLDNGFRPGGLMPLSSTTVSGVDLLQDYGSTYAPGTATHSLTLYRHPSGALVFGGGTVQWSWGLDGTHDRGASTADTRMRQATVNLFADMGVQPSTLQSGLVAATASADTLPPVTAIASPASGATLAPGTAIVISGTASDPGGIVTAVEVSGDGGATWKRATGRTSWTFNFTTGPAGPVTIRSRGVDDSGNIENPGASVNITVSNGGGPTGLVAAYSFNEGAGTTVADTSGQGNTGTLSGATWTTGKNGNALAFNGTSAWVTVPDAAALRLTLGMTLEAWVQPATLTNWRTVILKQTSNDLSYGLYAHDGSRPALWVNTGVSAGLSGPASLAANTWTHLAATYDGVNARLYVNGVQVASRAAAGNLAASTSPLRIGGNAVWGEYFNGTIDDVRVYAGALSAAQIVSDMNTPVGGTPPPDTVPPTVTATSPGSGASSVNPAANITVTFSEPMNASTIDGTTFELRNAANQLVQAAVTYNAATLTPTLDPTSDLTAGAVYTATLRGGATDPRVKDAAGNALTANAVWSFTIAGISTGCPCTIWSPSTTPATPDFGDPTAAQLGVKFQADRDGLVTGVRFYKGAGNTGTHVGSLWTAAGGLLGSVTFSGETATGWQQALFASAIAITANTVYVVSYYAPAGHYAANPSFFTSGVDNAPLHALSNATSANGVFSYSATPTVFPTQTFNARNYWVDVVYTDVIDTTPPVVSSLSPAAGATNVAISTSVAATFNEDIDPTTFTTSTLELRTPANALVAATVSYDAASRTATLQPSASLSTSTVYTATVLGGATDPRVKDSAGNALAANVTWSFTTSAPPPVVNSMTPASGATGVVLSAAVAATFSADIDPATVSTSTFELRTPANTLVPATVSYSAASRTATLVPSAPLGGSTVYTATVRGGSTDPRVKSTSGIALAANVVWSFTTTAPPPPPVNCPCSLWNDLTTPVTPSFSDPLGVELGLTFQADRNGFLTGIRFYKGPANTGTHVGSLWTAAGVLLGSVTFSGESMGGWQQASFASPIAISANTVYMASYYAPLGGYAVDSGFFAAAVDNGPLRALANSTSKNGLFGYSTTPSVFPAQSGNASNYWVDVMFQETLGPDTAPPVVTALGPAAAATNVALSAVVMAAFNEALNPATVTSSSFELRTPANVLVPATVSYETANRIATLQPWSMLAPSSVYTVTMRGGATDPRIKDVAGNALAANAVWSFTTVATPPAPPNEGPGGPILVVASSLNPFTRYYGEILRNEGLNLFTISDISLVTATTLNSYDIVILGEMALTSAQVSMLTTWVTAGGNLIAMRPDKQLAGLLGLTDAQEILSNQYLLIDSSGPGAGLVNQTIQFHGTADRYALGSAAAVATLYSSATTPTSNPAVSLRSVGSSGGQAAAFSYDLARSIIYTRQGNPSWAGQRRVGSSPIRSSDLFFGAASGDPQPDWVDLNKVAIPQADEQQRLLANLILQMSNDRKPLPRLWYLPRGLKAAVVMTGDDHAGGATAGRWDNYTAASPNGCSVANWECVRATSYLYPNAPLTNTQAASYNTAGFEVALHVTTNCLDYTPASLEGFYSNQLATWSAKYSSVPVPVTNRTHCIVWSDYASQPKVELAHGIRLDTTYYYWPDTWILDRPGMFSGSGMPMRFADTDGTTIDVYQAAAQMTDESGQTFPLHIDTLLNNALGATGYYGVFTANMHTDIVASAGSVAIVASAQARGVPIVSSKQMLTWLDGRNGSTFASLSWGGGTLTFTLVQPPDATGLQVMLPAQSSVGPLVSITTSGSSVPFTIQTIKGISYATFTGQAGAYSAGYSGTVPPDTTITASPAASTTSTNAGFSFTSTPAGATFECALDGAGFAACTTPQTYAALALGSHTFQVRAVNGSGSDPSPASFTWTITAPVPPDTTITSSPAASTTSTSASFSFTSTPAGATFECALDAAAFGACTTPQAYAALALGSHTFQVRAVNGSGTDPSPASFTWTITAPVPPDTTITSSPAASTTSTSASFSFTSTPSGATFECALDAAAFAACTTPQAYTALALGGHTFQVRAVNASGTDGSPASFSWTITASAVCPCSIWSAAAVPSTIDEPDGNAVELGVKFLSDRSGYISGIRFYKSAANTGTHTGHLWTLSGTSLGTVIFTGETASGWQQAMLASPIPVTANTTYVASYYSPVGHYSANGGLFNAAVDNPPLHAPATGTTPNGVYRYGASTFPNQTFNASNYWVDVVFVDSVGPDTTAPAVLSVSPSNGSTGVSPTAAATAVFSEDINPATIGQTTFELRDASNTLMLASVTYNASTRTATLQPSAVLSVSTTYTARLLGGSIDPRVKDVAGNALAGTFSWSFTTSSSLTPVTAFPSATVVQAGTLASGTASSLSSDDNVYYQVTSTTTGTRTSDWYGSFNVPNELGNLTVSYRGKNSAASVAQTIAIWRWTDSTWVQLDSRTVGTTEVAILNLVSTGTLADYVNGASGVGELRIRVRGTKTTNFISQGDLLSITYNP